VFTFLDTLLNYFDRNLIITNNGTSDMKSYLIPKKRVLYFVFFRLRKFVSCRAIPYEQAYHYPG